MRFVKSTSALLLTCVVSIDTASAQVAGLPEALSDEDTRLTMGVESLSLASTKGTQHFLLDFMLTAPLSGPETSRKTKPLWGAWLNTRFNGAANSSVSGIKQFVGGFEDELISGEAASLLNALTLRAGLEFALGNGMTFQKHYQFQPALIAGVGVTTVPALDKPAIFVLTDEARARWSVPATYPGKTTPITYIGLTVPDRRRYHKKVEFGVRLKTHHFDDCDVGRADCDPDARVNFPGIIDLTLGQDAAITGGKRRGLVGSIDAFYPLPTDTLANAIYLFGRLRVQWVKGVPAEEKPIILKGADATVQVPSDDLWLHTLTPDERTRDDWKFGIGLDLIRLFTGTAAARERDEAEALREVGSIVTLVDESEIAVANVSAQNQETLALVHGVDFFLPRMNGRFEVRPPSGDALTMKTFTKDTPDPAMSVRQRYKNVTGSAFETLLIRVKPGEPKDDALRKFELTNAQEADPVAADARYAVTRVSCKANCVVSSAKDTNNLLIVIPLTDATMKVSGASAASWNAYKPLVAARRSELKIEGGNVEFFVVRVR